MPETFTDDELETFARLHVCYEIGAAANLTISWYYSQLTASRPVQSALMSATLVHLRLLADFVHRQPRGDDVAAPHYLPMWQCPNDPLGTERSEIDGHVAHMTMRRQTRRLWDIIDVASVVFRELSRFTSELRGTRFEPAFEDCHDVVWQFLMWVSDSSSILETGGELAPDLEAVDPDWYRRLPAMPDRQRGS